MPFDAQGRFSLPQISFVETGETVLPQQHNTPMLDIQSGLGQTIVRDGRAVWTGDQNAGGKRIANLGPATEDGDAVRADQVQENAFQIGDWLDTSRPLSSNWLPRDGSVYGVADYPDLAPLMDEYSDQLTWEVKDVGGGAAGLAFRAVEKGAANYAAIGARVLRVSEDNAETWEYRYLPSDETFVGLAYGGGRFVGCNRNATVIITSTDDANSFSSASYDLSSQIREARGVVYAGQFLMFGRQQSPGRGALVKSALGAAPWSTVSLPSTADELRGGCVNGSVVVLVGDNGTIIVSTSSGNGFSLVDPGIDADLYGARYANGVYVIVGEGVILTSTNLTAWTERDPGVDSVLRSIDHNGGLWLAAGDGGVALTSEDLVQWSQVETNEVIALNSVKAIAGASQRFVVAGASGAIRAAGSLLDTEFRVPNDKPSNGWIKAL